MKMPLRSNLETRVSICRFFNYSTIGCKKHGDGLCELDHETCHICLETGHKALECPQYLDDALFEAFRATYTLKNTRPEDYPTKTVLGDVIRWYGDTEQLKLPEELFCPEDDRQQLLR